MVVTAQDSCRDAIEKEGWGWEWEPLPRLREGWTETCEREGRGGVRLIVVGCRQGVTQGHVGTLNRLFVLLGSALASSSVWGLGYALVQFF